MPDMSHAPHARPRVTIRQADPGDREAIYRTRHEVYATELGQHPENAEGRLTDYLDESNFYIVATVDGELAGFVSITPPGGAGYSTDKYFRREDLCSTDVNGAPGRVWVIGALSLLMAAPTSSGCSGTPRVIRSRLRSGFTSGLGVWRRHHEK